VQIITNIIMKEKISLFVACIIIGFGFGASLYFIADEAKTTKAFLSYSITFGIGMFVFELFIRPAINKIFKKDN